MLKILSISSHHTQIKIQSTCTDLLSSTLTFCCCFYVYFSQRISTSSLISLKNVPLITLCKITWNTWYNDDCDWCMCAPLSLTLCDAMDCSLPGFSVHGIFQARILEWVAISYSRGSSQPRDRTCIACVCHIGRLILYHLVPPGKISLFFLHSS